MFQMWRVVHILLSVHRPRTTASTLDRNATMAGRSDTRFDGPPGFVPQRWDKTRHSGRLRASAAVGGRSGWCTGGRLPIMIDRRGGCRVPLPAPDLHLRLRGYMFRREATSAPQEYLVGTSPPPRESGRQAHARCPAATGDAGTRAQQTPIVGAESAFFMSEPPLADDSLSMFRAAASGGEGYKPPLAVPTAGADVPRQ